MKSYTRAVLNTSDSWGLSCQKQVKCRTIGQDRWKLIRNLIFSFIKNVDLQNLQTLIQSCGPRPQSKRGQGRSKSKIEFNNSVLAKTTQLLDCCFPEGNFYQAQIVPWKIHQLVCGEKTHSIVIPEVCWGFFLMNICPCKTTNVIMIKYLQRGSICDQDFHSGASFHSSSKELITKHLRGAYK